MNKMEEEKPPARCGKDYQNKKRKLMSTAAIDDSDDVEEERTSIFQKLQKLRTAIDLQRDVVDAWQEGEKESVSYKVLYELEKKRNEFEKKRIEWLAGEYFAAMSNIWEKKVIYKPSSGGTNWAKFMRASEEVNFEIRHWGKAGGYLSNDPYRETRQNAESTATQVVLSNSTTNSASTQGNKTIRDHIWPTDVFGNPENSQPIAHFLPAGSQDHKEWFHVAGAVVGLMEDDSKPLSDRVLQKKKASRGVVAEENNLEEIGGEKKANSQARREAKLKRRKALTGVIHFVSNKIRLSCQEEVLDGNDPKCLFVPVMTVEEARKWKGEGYKAIFLLGKPFGEVLPDNLGLDTVYCDVRLNTLALLEKDHVADATTSDIETARTLLETSVIALREMIASLSDEEIKHLGLSNPSNLEEARALARKDECIVPGAVDAATHNPKPVCLVTFGEKGDNGRHPSSDPLLLSLRAASVWGMMVGQRMLANGYAPAGTENMTEGDIIAEQAYYDNVFGCSRPTTWEDLARGLGQPNGYS